ncbi:MAG: endonuclease/exonuclease/phosphatase family protein [Anaerolineae bacterium]|nr:endonuclease/exonuclease/phosphatase family protein [Anaerolineae bacterium]
MRAMSLNIWNYNDPWPRRRDLIVAAVRAAAADVIAFQEIRGDPDRDEIGAKGNRLNQAEQIAARLSEYPHLIVRPAMHYPDGAWEGLAILSRISFIEHGWIPLTRDPTDPEDRHQRILLYARLEVSGDPLWLFNTHLSLSRAARARNVEEILAHTARFTGRRLLMGDLNELPDQAPMAMLYEAGWRDVWATLRPDEPGFTYRSDGPWQRIDYAWASPELVPFLRDIELAASQPGEDGIYPSDHIGLIVTISESK